MSNRAEAQTQFSNLPDASTGWNSFSPSEPPPFRFQDANGKALTLGHFKGHVLLVNFWATWCGPCKEELPTFSAMVPKLAKFGGLVLPVSVDVDGVKAVRAYFTLQGIKNLPVLVDPDGDDLDMLHTDGIPVTLVVNPAGKVVARLDGAADWNTKSVLGYLENLAKGGAPNPDGFTQT